MHSDSASVPQHVTGETFPLEVTFKTSVSQLKEQLHTMFAILPEDQRLIHMGRPLEDHCTLYDCGVQKQSTLYIVLRLRGGAGCTAFADVSNPGVYTSSACRRPAARKPLVSAVQPVCKSSDGTAWLETLTDQTADALEEVSFSRSAPGWQRAGWGLNVEGICDNPGCQAHGNMFVDTKIWGCCCVHAVRMTLILYSQLCQQQPEQACMLAPHEQESSQKAPALPNRKLA